MKDIGVQDEIDTLIRAIVAGLAFCLAPCLAQIQNQLKDVPAKVVTALKTPL
jgi:hypothetical protein